MDISMLEEFVSLTETCSFQETAALMNMSQSSLTKHIHKLEEELNLTLFDRSSRNVKLNEYSRALYPYAKQIVALQKESLASLADLSQKNRNHLTIAYSPVLGQYGLVRTLAEFEKKYPERSLHTIETYQPLTLLRSKKCDFVFLAEDESDMSDCNKMIYVTDHLTAVLPDDHPLASRESVTLEQLRNEKFIIHSSSSPAQHEETRKFLELCSAAGIQPEIVAESQFTATVVRYVSAGRGIAVLNGLNVPHEAQNIRIVDISPTVYSYFYLVYPRRITSSYASDFLHFMIEQINSQ